MDLADQAEALEAQERDHGIALARAHARTSWPVSATCLNCDEPTTAGARWCTPECRDDFLRLQARLVKGN